MSDSQAGAHVPSGNPHLVDPEEFDRDLDVPLILGVTAGVLVITLLSAVAMWGVMVGFDRFDRAHAEAPPPMAAGRPEHPAGALLQAAPTADMQEMHASDLERLDHAGWVDRSQGTVRLPISVAIDVLAARGLPQVTTPPLAEMAAHGSSADDGRPPVDQPSPGTLLPPPGMGMSNIGPPSAGAGQQLGAATPLPAAPGASAAAAPTSPGAAARPAEHPAARPVTPIVPPPPPGGRP
jgi:hypothetical protein